MANDEFKRFKKGDLVTHVTNWDSKGTFAYYHAVVYSCGRKQMVLTDASTGEERGRHFAPEVATKETSIKKFVGMTFPRMTDEDAVATCLELAAKFLIHERAYLINIQVKNAETHSADDRMNNLYRDTIQNEIDALHEPRAIVWEKK